MCPERLIATPKAFHIENCLNRIAPHRKIEGICAVLLPFDQKGTPDFQSFARLVDFTARSGLTPAVNMDTGYVHLLSQQDRAEVLRITRQVMSGRRFVAGAFIEGRGGPTINLYLGQVDSICSHDGTPILFQCSALKGKSADEIAAIYQAVASRCDGLLAFELGEMFAPFGQIYSLEAVESLMRIPQILGMKHSSLDRRLEWERLELRDRLRPDFKIYTGNDLAIAMGMYGTDYL